MGFPLIITSGDDLAALPDEVMQWLIEARVELELSQPTRYALRFQDDVCDDNPHIEGLPDLAAGRNLGLFVEHDGGLECLVFGPITEVKSSSMIGGGASWAEVRGEDRRVEMDRVGVQATYTGRASAVAESILGLYEFTADTQQTLIEYDAQRNQLSQRGTDLGFLDDIARRNNMEFWISYTTSRNSSGAITLTETANLRTSPTRTQPGDVPQLPVLSPPPERRLRINPPLRECPSVSRFEADIDFEKPTASRGFAMSDDDDREIVEQIVADAEPVDPARPPQIAGGPAREAIAPPEATQEEAFLAKEAIVFEQSWFVEVEASSSLEQAGFVILPHQIVDVTHAGARLSGAYQVMQATHVVTRTDHLIDFKLRANGLGGAA